MRKVFWLGLLAVPAILLLTLPARVITPYLDIAEDVRDVQGTIWSGQAVWQQPGQVPLDLDWRWDSGRRWSWQAVGDGVDLSGYWIPANGGTRLEEVSGSVAMKHLDAQVWLANVRPRGQLEIALARVFIADGAPPEIDGSMIWRNARLEGAVHESLGEITVRLVAEDAHQQARIESTEPGAVQIRGTIEFGVEDYQLDLWLRASPNRPELVRQIAWLGEPQPDGQVRIELGGMLGW